MSYPSDWEKGLSYKEEIARLEALADPDDAHVERIDILPPQFTERGGIAYISPEDAERFLSTKETVLEEAARISSGDRQRYYGHPADNHGNTAELWAAYLERRFGTGVALTARDVCLMMILLKVSRDANAVKRDNLVDICGYARNAEQIEERG